MQVAVTTTSASAAVTRAADRAQQARELLVGAHAATLTTSSCTAGSTTTVVDLRDAELGSPRLVLDQASPAVSALAVCRVAVLRVVDLTSDRSLRLTVSLRMGRPDASGRRAYDATLLSVRVEDARGVVTVPVGDFLRATPDLARVRRAALAAHLEASHAAELLAGARADGHDCQLVLAVQAPAIHAAPGSQGQGLELHALGVGGVVRLALTQTAVDAACGCPAAA